MVLFSRSIVGLVASIVIGGCGDSAGDISMEFGSCQVALSEFEACGGDVEGAWSGIQACIDNAGLLQQIDFSEFCPEAEASVDLEILSGTTTFSAGVMEMRDFIARTNLRLALPNSCLQGATCGQVQSALNQFAAEDPDLSFTASCGGGSTCSCAISIALDIEPIVQDYRTEGDMLIFSDGDIDVSSVPYCIRNDELAFESGIDGDSLGLVIYRKQ